jgi:hypothetical protein
MTQKQLQRRQVMKNPTRLAEWLNQQFNSGFTAVTLHQKASAIPHLPIIASIVELSGTSCQINFHPKATTKTKQ